MSDSLFYIKKLIFIEGEAVARTQLGLGNVDNTSDANKPVSIATQSELDSRIETSAIGSANGVCPLDIDSLIPVEYLPDTPETIDGGDIG
jgi:hypothetical protein